MTTTAEASTTLTLMQATATAPGRDDSIMVAEAASDNATIADATMAEALVIATTKALYLHLHWCR